MTGYLRSLGALAVGSTPQLRRGHGPASRRRSSSATVQFDWGRDRAGNARRSATGTDGGTAPGGVITDHHGGSRGHHPATRRTAGRPGAGARPPGRVGCRGRATESAGAPAASDSTSRRTGAAARTDASRGARVDAAHGGARPAAAPYEPAHLAGQTGARATTRGRAAGTPSAGRNADPFGGRASGRAGRDGHVAPPATGGSPRRADDAAQHARPGPVAAAATGPRADAGAGGTTAARATAGPAGGACHGGPDRGPRRHRRAAGAGPAKAPPGPATTAPDLGEYLAGLGGRR